MHEAFSFNREYDYVRLDGLSRATGRPAHEWDIYIVKELIDNALDADELLWQLDSRLLPSVHILMEYISAPLPQNEQNQQLFIRVLNRAMFPVKQIEAIFSTQWYTSQKAFIKGFSRGALGNASKTLLGIPYALHNYISEDWTPHLKPLSICCGGIEYLPSYIIDATTQSIHFYCAEHACKPFSGTLISIGLDYFEQEKPRNLVEIEILAEHYHLCNPHATFCWTVEIKEQVWQKEYTARSDWTNKFRGYAPIQWYSLTEFRDLLGALYRKQIGNQRDHKLPILEACQYFAGFSITDTNQDQYPRSLVHVIQEVGQNSFTKDDIDSSFAKTLYTTLKKFGPAFHSSQLGYIGQEHVCSTLNTFLPIIGKIRYAAATDEGSDPNTPFVIEAAVALLKEGRRQLLTAINFSPTYGDPFSSRWLHTLNQPDKSVLGLRGILDAYNFREETSIVLFLHVVCPNIEHNEFSKTEINHIPFKLVLSKLLDKLLTELRQGYEEEEIQLQQAVFQALNAILDRLDVNERFIPEQLLEILRQRLHEDQTIAAWLERPDAMNRLRTYISSYQNYNPQINHYVARQADVLLHIPLHPKHYFSLPIGYASSDLLERYYVNKILYVNMQELEPVILENNWLCRMDMALLHIPIGQNMLEEVLLQCVNQNDLVILVLHNADEGGYSQMEKIHAYLKQHHINPQRVIDLNSHNGTRINDSIQPTKCMPSDLEKWLLKRFIVLDIAEKYTSRHIRKDICRRFEQLLRGYLLEGVVQQFELTSLVNELDNKFSYIKRMMEGSLDERLKFYLKQMAPTESYASALNNTIEGFFSDFIDKYETEVQKIEQAWLVHKRFD